MRTLRVALGLSLLVLDGGAHGQTVSTAEPVRVSSGTMAGQIVSRPDPVFVPGDAAVVGSGAVVLRVRISKDGRVERISRIMGEEVLSGYVMDAVSRWVYRPYLLNGAPTAVDTTVMMNIDFSGGPRPAFCPGETVQPKHVSSESMGGLLKHRVNPRLVSKDTAVPLVVVACVSASGTVTRTEALSGPKGLRKGVEEAVAQWRFRPYLVGGEAAPVITTFMFQPSHAGDAK